MGRDSLSVQEIGDTSGEDRVIFCELCLLASLSAHILHFNKHHKHFGDSEACRLTCNKNYDVWTLWDLFY